MGEDRAAVIVIERLDPDDWRTWREVRLAALAEAPYAFGSTLAEWTGEGDREDRWRQRLSTVPLNLIAFVDGQPVGQASGTAIDAGGRVQLISMWVAPHWRGLGVSVALIEAIVDWATGQGATAVVLAVKSANDHATWLYERLHFTPTAEPPEELDEVVMARALTPAYGGDDSIQRWEAAKRLANGPVVRGARLDELLAVAGGKAEEAAVYALGSCSVSQRRLAEVVGRLADIAVDPSVAGAVRGLAAEGIGNHFRSSKQARLRRLATLRLVECLADPDPHVRFWSAWSLGQLRARSARGVLRRLVNDQTVVDGWWSVGVEAAAALDAIEGRALVD